MREAVSGNELDDRSSERRRLRRENPLGRHRLVMLRPPATPTPMLAIAAILALAIAPESLGLVDLAFAQEQRVALSVGSAITVQPATETRLAIQVRPQGSVPKNHFVRIRGLPAAAVLSEGHAISPGSWAVPLIGLPNLKITVPSVSQGQFNVAVSLLTVDGTILDDVKTVLIVGPATLSTPLRDGQSSAPASVASIGPSAAATPEASSPAREQALKLHAKGQEQLDHGNIAAARMFFLRAAQAGLPHSALALGGTYDPLELARLKVIGLKPDPEAARKWYEKARELGSIEAVARLNRLGAR